MEKLKMTEKDSSKSEAVLVKATEGSTAIAESSASTPLRDLDFQIAERVFGLYHEDDDGTWRVEATGKLEYLAENLPHFSTDISDAWRVVEKLREDGWCIDIRIDDEPWDTEWHGTYGVALLGCNRGRTDCTDIRETAATLPEAICLAALRSLNQRT